VEVRAAVDTLTVHDVPVSTGSDAEWMPESVWAGCQIEPKFSKPEIERRSSRWYLVGCMTQHNDVNVVITSNSIYTVFNYQDQSVYCVLEKEYLLSHSENNESSRYTLSGEIPNFNVGVTLTYALNI
jgi:hypothetical protein